MMELISKGQRASRSSLVFGLSYACAHMFSFAQHNQPMRAVHSLFSRAGNGDSESGDDLLKPTPRDVVEWL